MLNANPPDQTTPAGIDVSHFQLDIDWAAVGASGINFCFIKASEGAGHADAKFERNWQASADAGIARGAYHLFQPADPVTAQANFFLGKIAQPPAGDLPPVLDLEDPARWADIPRADRALLAVEWLREVGRSLSATPLIYLSPAFADEVLGNSPLLAQFPVWLADYTGAPAPSIPKPWNAWTFWQRTGKGTTSGVAGFVDLNRFNGTLEELWALKVR